MAGVSKKPERTSRLKEARRRRRKILLGALIFLLCACIGGIAYASRLPEVTVSAITVSGQDVVTQEEVVAKAQEAMQGTYLFLIPKENSFFYPKKKIESNILATLPRVKQVSVHAEGLTGLSITIVERKPKALSCTYVQTPAVLINETATSSASTAIDAPNTLLQSETCYYIDDDGFVFAESPSFSGSAFFKYRTVYQEAADPRGTFFMESGAYHSVDAFIQKLITDVKLAPVSLSYDETGVVEIQLKDGGRIVYRNSQDLDTLFDAISSVFKSDEITSEKRSSLDYVDFRYGNKIYVKYR